MRRLLLKMTFFVLGLWLLLNILGYVADRIAPLSVWYERAEKDYTNLIKQKDTIQAVSLGNSHSEAIDFDTLGVRGQTLARAGADLLEVERYAASVVDSLPGLETVFITLPYYAFSWDNSTRNNTQILRIELYAMLPIWKAVEGDGGNLVLGKLHRVTRLMSVARPDHWHDVIYSEVDFSTLFSNSPEFDAVSVETSKSCPHLTPVEQERHAQEIAGKNVASSRAMANTRQGLSEDAFEALADTVEHLQGKGVRVILYTPPYYEAYTTHFVDQGSDIIVQMHQAVRRLQEEYQVEYYDFSKDPNLTTQYELFVNSDHLNDCGAKAFSERLLQAMLETGHNSSYE